MMISNKVENLKGLIISEVTNYFKNTKKTTDKSSSKYYEDVCTSMIINILKKHLPEVTINSKSKREYPEVEFTYDNKLYAIDIKTAKNDTKPAFDLCYVSTFELERFNCYESEWILSIAYDGQKEIHNSFVDCHFNNLHSLVDKTKNGLLLCGGHAVKVRPLTWSEIRNENFKIKSRKELLDLSKKTYQEKNKVEKYKLIMDKQLSNLNNPKRKSKFQNEEGLVDYIFNVSPHLDFKKVRKLIKNRILVSQ